MIQAVLMMVGMGAVLLLAWQSETAGVGPVPTGRRVRQTVLDMLAGENPRNIIELGSGWGGMTRLLARTFPDAFVTGYERSFLPLWRSRLALWGYPRATAKNADIFDIDVTDADLVFCYLSPAHMQRLQDRFAAQVKAGAVVVSVSFPLPDRVADETRTVKGIVDIPVYLYRW